MIESDQADRIAVLLFTDIVDSVGLQRRLGTQVYSEILRQHDQLFHLALDPIPSDQPSQDTGDGQLAQFNTAADAIAAALRFQFLLRSAHWPHESPPVRVGVHQGQVTDIQISARGPRKVVGMPVNIAARIMGLAQGGQILLTRSVFDDARQFIHAHPEIEGVQDLPAIEWTAHGRYMFKGAKEPMEVFEVGVAGRPQRGAPPDSEKAHRAVSPEEEATLGWRPGVGLEIPHRQDWILEEKLGEGGFGEVWLAEQKRLKQRRVFKFCFDTGRLRSFRREVTLFRLIRQALGDREDIAPIHDIQLDSSPFFLELGYAEGGDLKNWAEQQGGWTRYPWNSAWESSPLSPKPWLQPIRWALSTRTSSPRTS